MTTRYNANPGSPNPMEAVEAAERAKTQASKALEDAKVAASQASLARVRALQQSGADYQIAAQSLLAAAQTVGDLPGVFTQDDFENALGRVDMIVATSRRLATASARGSTDQAMLDAQTARGGTFATATAALQTQITNLQAALLEASAPDVPDKCPVDGLKSDFATILSNGNVNSQAQALATQLRQRNDLDGLSVLLGNPCRYLLQGLGVNRTALLRSYVSGVFADLTTRAIKMGQGNGYSAAVAAEQAPRAVRGMANPGPLPVSLVARLQDCVVNDAGQACLDAARAVVGMSGTI